MSISSTGLYGSATIVNSDLFNDVETLKEQVTTLSTSYLQTTQEHREDTSQNRQDISSNLSKINDISNNRKKIVLGKGLKIVRYKTFIKKHNQSQKRNEKKHKEI